MKCINCDKEIINNEVNICVLCGSGYCNECEEGMLRYSKVADGEICDDNCFLPSSVECRITNELINELEGLLK